MQTQTGYSGPTNSATRAQPLDRVSWPIVVESLWTYERAKRWQFGVVAHAARWPYSTATLPSHISKKAKKLQALISACNCIKHSKQVLELQVLKPPTVFGNLIIISYYNFNYFCGLGCCSPITWSISVSTKWNIGNHKPDFQSTKVLKLSTVFGNLIIIPHYNFNYFCGLEHGSCFFVTYKWLYELDSQPEWTNCQSAKVVAI